MTQQSVVIELQSLATDSKNDITDLLRKALLVASKLKLDEFKSWVNHELHGYRDGSAVPQYRKARAELKLKNPFHGLVPIVIDNEEFVDALCNIEIRESVGSLEHLVKGSEKGGLVTFPLPDQAQAILMEIQDTFGKLPGVRVIGRNRLAAAIDAVRTTVLEWSLRLEAEGILGEGLTFSAAEKDKAVSSSNISIHNFQGVFGNVSDSVVSQNLNLSVSPGNFESLAAFLGSKGVNETDIADLKRTLSEEPKPASADKFGKKVSGWIGRMVTKAADGTWAIGLGAAGNLLSAAIAKYYGV